jgi:hypothetical protein
MPATHGPAMVKMIRFLVMPYPCPICYGLIQTRNIDIKPFETFYDSGSDPDRLQKDVQPND